MARDGYIWFAVALAVMIVVLACIAIWTWYTAANSQWVAAQKERGQSLCADSGLFQ